MDEKTNAMKPGLVVDWGWSDTQYTPGRPGHGVAPLSYDAAAVHARGGRAADPWGGGRGRGQSDHVWPDRPVCDGAGAARRTPDPAPDQRDAARTQSRRAQPTAARAAAVHASGDAGAYRLRPADEPAAGHARLPVRGRRRGREAVRQVVAMGRVDVLARQEAEGLRRPCGVALVDERS